MKKRRMKFGNIFSIILIVLAVLGLFNIYKLNVLPLVYYIILFVGVLFFLFLLILMMHSKRRILRFLGEILTLGVIMISIMGINYEAKTLDFLQGFGLNNYKTENYNIVVLKESSINTLKELDNKKIGHLDANLHVGLSKAIDKLSQNIEFKSVAMDDINELTQNLKVEKVDAIVLEDARMDILKEENPQEYETLKVIDSIKVRIKMAKLGKAVDVIKDPFNIYISGIDTYGNITKVSRSDVNMLVSLNPSKGKILLTNIPRDYYVKLHTYEQYDKLTHAGIYGINESMQTIEDLLDTKINYYLKVNFTTLVSVVDALGGIDVVSNYAFTSQDGYTYKKGVNHLDGKKALSFARERKAFSAGDRVRGENQQLVLTSIIDKLSSIKAFSEYTHLLDAVDGEFMTNLSDKDITSFIKEVIKSGKGFEVASSNLAGTNSYEYTYSYKKNKLYVMKPSLESINNAQEKINNILIK